MKRIKKLVNITNLQRKQKIDQRLVRYFVKSAVDSLFCGSYSIDIIFCSPDYIKKLNKNYRGKNTATDVLSFETGEFTDNIFYIGEIYIAPSVALKNAVAYKNFWEREEWVEKTERFLTASGGPNKNNLELFNKELTLLIIHGILHLFGYNHDEEHTLDINDENYDKEMKEMQRVIYRRIEIK